MSCSRMEDIRNASKILTIRQYQDFFLKEMEVDMDILDQDTIIEVCVKRLYVE